MTPQYFISAFTPSSVLQARMHKRVIARFADKIGMVYFGYVDQQSDEHRLIRGLTLSPRHRDNNYCIGSHDGYDITLVERADTIKFPGKTAKKHNWIVMTFDLHTSIDLPHIFLGLNTHSQEFYAHLFTKFGHLSKVHIGAFGTYESSFTSRYSLYASPSQALAAERLFNPFVGKKIVSEFGTLTFEVADHVLYVYSEHQRLTSHLLDHMLKSGLWLARAIDESHLE